MREHIQDGGVVCGAHLQNIAWRRPYGLSTWDTGAHIRHVEDVGEGLYGPDRRGIGHTEEGKYALGHGRTY